MSFSNRFLKAKFKVGDEVLYKFIDEGEPNPSGLIGTIVHIRSYDYGVSFPGFEWGHNLCGNLKTKDGWYCSEENLTLTKKRGLAEINQDMSIGD